MKMIMLSKASDNLLSARLSAYVDAVSVTLAALGLEGEWKYDPQIGAMVQEEVSPATVDSTVPDS